MFKKRLTIIYIATALLITNSDYDLHAYGPDAVRFYTKRKTITQRWPSAGVRVCGCAGVREGAVFSFLSSR